MVKKIINAKKRNSVIVNKYLEKRAEYGKRSERIYSNKKDNIKENRGYCFPYLCLNVLNLCGSKPNKDK